MSSFSEANSKRRYPTHEYRLEHSKCSHLAVSAGGNVSSSKNSDPVTGQKTGTIQAVKQAKPTESPSAAKLPLLDRLKIREKALVLFVCYRFRCERVEKREVKHECSSGSLHT